MDKKVVFLIPAYEPGESMIDLLKEINNKKMDIVVVDDGSGDQYKDIFKQASKYAKVLKHDINKGKGRALKTGLNYIKDNIDGNYVVVTVDCDGQHKVIDALKLVDYTNKNPLELVLGKRVRSGKTPLRSRVGNAITRFIYRVTTGLDVYDTQTGLRAFSNELIDFMLEIEGERFEYEMNVLLKCSLSKIKITELEIETIYIDNNSHSHFKAFRDSILIYKEIFKFLMSSMCSFFIDYLLFSLIVVITNKIIVANVVARIVSASINFKINKSIVFNNKENIKTQAFKYFLLAIVILILNTCILKLLVDYLFVNKFVSKLLVEFMLMFLSFIVQKKFVFGKKN